MKRILMATGVAVLALATVVGAQAYQFNNNLTVGSTGPDVVELQSWLIAKGYSIPAVTSGAAAKGYFGSQTKAAVSAYQKAVGLPSFGFFGPMTRALVNGGTSGTPVTGVACPAGYTCTPVGGGTPVTGTPSATITTPGAEGLITTKLASQPIADADIRISTNVPVYGIEVKGQGSDMIVDRVLLQVGVTVSSAATNPSTFIKKLHAYDGSTLLKSWDLASSDWNKDSSDRYYIIASGLKFLVPKDTTKVLTFKVDTTGVSSDQAARVATFQGYAGNTQNVRAVDGAGLNSYTDMSGSANSRQQTFNSSGTSNLTVTLNSTLTPKAQNNRVDSSDGNKGLTMQVFDVKSTTGNSILKKVYVALNATSSSGLPSTVYLYEGSTMLKSVSAPTSVGTQAGFTDIDLSIPKDTTKQFTVKADFPSTSSGQAASTSIPASGVQFEKPDGTTSSSSIPSSALAGNDQYLFAGGVKWELVSTGATASDPVKDVASSSVTGTITLKGTAFGGSMTKPAAGDFTLVFASSTATSTALWYWGANSVTGGNKTITVDPTSSTVGDGGVYTVTLTDTIYSSDSELASSQPLFMAIKDIDAVVGGVTITNQTWGVDTFYTPAKQLTRGTY